MFGLSRTTMGRLSPCATLITGTALGPLAGIAVDGAVSSAAEAKTAPPAAYKAPAATATASHPACAKGATLVKGDCVVHVTKTLITTPGATAAHQRLNQPGRFSTRR